MWLYALRQYAPRAFGIIEVRENFCIQQFVAEATVETLRDSILPKGFLVRCTARRCLQASESYASSSQCIRDRCHSGCAWARRESSTCSPTCRARRRTSSNERPRVQHTHACIRQRSSASAAIDHARRRRARSPCTRHRSHHGRFVVRCRSR